ncbi:uncharacterized protein Dana_GF20028 [Drosophila ananassae]|uniref:Uncharacterized protein n=1 Tax=Drosophila ananassae TaxID=7217 RepID=B3MVD5_DROAN|nr:uncharacterized protein LOC6502756 [Drosophila ananassae]EDV33200.1 uncharacterized protein Dana_GF20028 [Drosophila ananassae]
MLTKKFRLLNCSTKQVRGLAALKAAMALPEEKPINTKSEVHRAPYPFTMKVAPFIDPKCIQKNKYSSGSKVQQGHRGYTFDYHAFSMYDLMDAALKAKEESAKYAKNRIEMERQMLLKMKIPPDF